MHQSVEFDHMFLDDTQSKMEKLKQLRF